MWGRPRIFATGCGPISEGATIPRQKPWYLRLWILNLSSPSPILRPCFLRSTSSRRTSPSTISCSRTTSPIPSSRLPMSAIRVSSSRARSKRMVVSISVPIQMWERLMRSSGYWIEFSHSASVPIRLLRFAFTTI